MTSDNKGMMAGWKALLIGVGVLALSAGPPFVVMKYVGRPILGESAGGQIAYVVGCFLLSFAWSTMLMLSFNKWMFGKWGWAPYWATVRRGFVWIFTAGRRGGMQDRPAEHS